MRFSYSYVRYPKRSSSDIRNDYDGMRVGNRVVSCGEHPYYDPNSKSRREALNASIVTIQNSNP